MEPWGIVAILVITLFAGIMFIFVGLKSEEKGTMTIGILFYGFIAWLILIFLNIASYYKGEDSSGAVRHLCGTSSYEVLVTTTTPDGETLIQVSNLDTLIDPDKRKKIGIFPSFPPEGHALGIADKRTFLIPSGSSLAETTDGKIVLVWPNGTGEVIVDTK